MSDKSEQNKARREAAENRAAQKRIRRAHKAKQVRDRDAIVVKALLTHQSKEDKFREATEELRDELVTLILTRAPKLMDQRFLSGLQELSGLPWARDLKDWAPKGKSPNSLFRSLLKHLLVKYTMPAFMYSVFFEEEDEDTRRCGIALFAHLGKGGSLSKAIKARILPVPLTKKSCHVFMQTTVNHGFVSALRHAQVSTHGGDHRLAEAIMATRQLGRGFTVNEDFWDHVIQWTCNQAMLAPAQVAPIYDWVARNQAVGFSMKGRTGISVLRAVEEWHGELAKEKKIHGHLYDPSGFLAWKLDRKIRLPSGGDHIESHTITEILTSKSLAAEGRKLKHCVYSYSWSIQKGRVSIWSYKVDENQTLTIEVDNPTRRVVQVRGHHNAKATPKQMNSVQRWMAKSELVLSTWI